MDIVFEGDRAMMEVEWHNITVLRQKRFIELRLRKKWYHGESGKWKNVWILAAGKPEDNEDGSLKSIMGCITDISLQKVCTMTIRNRTMSPRIRREIAIASADHLPASPRRRNGEGDAFRAAQRSN